jgi:hypothetical protein
MLESQFSLTPPGKRGAYPESHRDFWGAILGYDSRISYPTEKQYLNPFYGTIVPRLGLALASRWFWRTHTKSTRTLTKESFAKERDESALSKWYSGSQYNGRHPRK